MSESALPTSVTEFPDDWYSLAVPNHFWMHWRYLAFEKMIQSTGVSLDKPLRVLDVGAGNGALQCQIEERSSWIVDSVDMDPQTVAKIPKGRGRAFAYDILNKTSNLHNQYDMVSAFDVIEHIEDSNKFVKALLAHVKPGGYVSINVPAIPSLFSHYDTIAGHQRRYTSATLQEEFSKLDVKILETRYWGLSLVPILAVRCFLYALRDPKTLTVEEGFKPPAPWINSAFRTLSEVETKWISRPLLGTSVMLIAQKREA